MDLNNVPAHFQSTGNGNSSSSNAKTCSNTRHASAFFPKGYLALIVLVVIVTIQFSVAVQAASLKKRSIDQSEEICRNNSICGWEVYHPSTRNLQYYVASSCKCSTKETCLRAEDDISISAYVFRCRNPTKRKTTRRPSSELNDMS